MRRAITLLEVMIVIFIIGIVAGVLGYNMKGSIDKGRAFKTKHAAMQLKDLLLLTQAESEEPITLDQLTKDPEGYIKKSPLVRNPKDILNDGWGQRLKVEIFVDEEGREDLRVVSEALEKYEKSLKK